MSYPKGYLVSIGGAEDKGIEKGEEKENSLDFLENGILKEVVSLLKKSPTKTYFLPIHTTERHTFHSSCVFYR